MKPVTMQQLTDWVEKNKHHTWFHGEGGYFDAEFSKERREKGSMSMKYLRFNLDTRDMMIFHIDADRAGAVDFRDPGEGSLLDELQKRIDARAKDLAEHRKKV